MSDGVLHIRDVQGRKKEGNENAMFAAVEQEIFKCQGMVEHGLSANHSMITDFIREKKIDTKSVGEVLSKIQEWIDRFQDPIYELQFQNCEYKSRFKRMSLAADSGSRRQWLLSLMGNLCLGR
ncbi:hypothetical protein D1007_05148 [Hordeum vulgare]|nr:hypothetical protein D1007_05148 [Hordeum vulgare]